METGILHRLVRRAEVLGDSLECTALETCVLAVLLCKIHSDKTPNPSFLEKLVANVKWRFSVTGEQVSRIEAQLLRRTAHLL